jgi:hypothetical protein
MDNWYLTLFIAGIEALIIWGVVELTKSAKMIYQCDLNAIMGTPGACTTGVVFPLLMAFIIDCAFITVGFIAIRDYLGENPHSTEVTVLAILAGIAGVLDLGYLFAESVQPAIRAFIDFEKGLSIPAIVIGIFIIAVIVYLPIWIGCELEERRERTEKARKDIAAQEAANHPQE